MTSSPFRLDLLGGPPVEASASVRDDEATTTEDVPVTIALTANDSPGLVVSIAEQPPFGAVTVLGGGAVRYEPPAHWAGRTTVEYRAAGDRALRAGWR